MSILVKQSLIRLALIALRGFSILRRGVVWFFVYSLFKPIRWMSFRAFRFILLPMYSRYTGIKNRLRNHPAFGELESIGHFVQRYALHVGLVLLGLFGLGHNLLARTIRPDEIGIGTLWAAYEPGSGFDVITETAATKLIEPPSLSAVAVGGPATLTAETPVETTLDQSITPGEAITVVGNAAGGIDNIGIEERVEVVDYTVQSGDTVSTIAVNFGLSSSTVLWANGLGEQDFIQPGQALKIPPVDGVLYTVKSGDTVGSIARKYQGDQDTILRQNNLASADALQINQQIIIPGGQPPAPPAPPQFAQVPNRRNILERVFVAPPSAPATNTRFRWPTSDHRINQYYRGPRYHAGVDIEGTYSSPIYASAPGVVTFAAHDRSGYGLHIVIDHGRGSSTLYGHASKVFVRAGQRVNQGQTIGMVGSTGRSTGTHLHFEIRVGGSARNPLSYL